MVHVRVIAILGFLCCPQLWAAESWSQWPWHIDAGAGSTIPHLLTANNSVDFQDIFLRQGAGFSLAGIEIRAFEADCRLSPVILADQTPGPIWLEKIDLRPEGSGRVVLDSRRAQIPKWNLLGLWQPPAGSGNESTAGYRASVNSRM